MKRCFETAKELYRDCFSNDETESDIILDFAFSYGKVRLLREEEQEAGMICHCDLSDGDFSAKYIFAACVKKEFRGRGFFRGFLEKTIGNGGAILIPQTRDLFFMYEKLGFTPVFHLETVIDGQGKGVPFCGSTDELYAVYKKSDLFPKKSRPLFDACISAFLHYGGRIMKSEECVYLLDGNRVSEVFAKKPSEAVEGLKKGVSGGVCAMLPVFYADALADNGYKYTKNAISMSKNVDCSKIYINNLFN